MKHLVVPRLPLIPALLLSLALGLTGCASNPVSVAPTVNIDNLPQTTLNGAKLDHARAVAMGTARANGWTIKTADANRLVLERTLPRASPQTKALGSTLKPPKMEVETDLVERREGTIVALRAFLIRNPGTAEEQRVDYTSEYDNQLMISLNSLQSAWLESRDQVSSTVPVPSAADLAEQTEAQDVLDSDFSTAEPMIASAPERPAAAPTAASAPANSPTTASVPAATTAAAERAPGATPTPVASEAARPVVAEPAPAPPPADTNGPAGAAPVGIASPPAYRQAPAADLEPNPTADAAPGNDMLVLDDSARKGLWAYYAEDYARLRGCILGDRGAVMLQETPEFELHEVACTGAANMLVKCQGGVCQGVR